MTATRLAMLLTLLGILLSVVVLAVTAIRIIRAAGRQRRRVCRAPGCDQANRKDAKFCARCGAPLNEEE